jgi:mannosyl-3-phosphoglycerate phosphatase
MPAESLVVFSDLDGTLLDHATYDLDAARPALERLRAAGVPLVLCTSKTRAEVEPVRDVLDNRHPFIVENGGGLYIPVGYFPFELEAAEPRSGYWVMSIGDPYPQLVRALARAAEASGVGVRGFASMSDEQVADATGLSTREARLARAREFDEPFVILEPERANDLLAAIERDGNRWTRGGRFYHITGPSDKAGAVRRLISLYRRQRGETRTVGLGDAPNDAGFLSVVDVPILLASPRLDQLRALVPRGQETVLAGPSGWNEAVLAVLDAWQGDEGLAGQR